MAGSNAYRWSRQIALGGKEMAENDSAFGRRTLLGLVVIGLAGSGCRAVPDKGLSGPASEVVSRGFNFPPRIRYGVSPTPTSGTHFVGGDLGTHGYYFRLSEKNGMAYTSRGGHIDTAHLRIASDWTAYLAAESYRHLMRGDRSFSYRLLADRSPHYVQISYPANWQGLSPKQRSDIAREVALTMGPYLAYNMITWHEILTWHGYKSTGIVPEFHSAFSWEDGYSNLLGTIVASKALRDPDRSYEEALTAALAEELHQLGVQPAAISKQASVSVRGKWYSGRIGMFINMKKRNLDIGVDNGLVTPILVPDVPGCAGAEPACYPAPTLDALSCYGFSAFVEIEPHELEKGKILRIVYPDGQGRRIRIDGHFTPIMRHIRQEAAARYGPEYASN
jgi:hypothetical protein